MGVLSLQEHKEKLQQKIDNIKAIEFNALSNDLLSLLSDAIKRGYENYELVGVLAVALGKLIGKLEFENNNFYREEVFNIIRKHADEELLVRLENK